MERWIVFDMEGGLQGLDQRRALEARATVPPLQGHLQEGVGHRSRGRDGLWLAFGLKLHGRADSNA